MLTLNKVYYIASLTSIVLLSISDSNNVILMNINLLFYSAFMAHKLIRAQTPSAKLISFLYLFYIPGRCFVLVNNMEANWSLPYRGSELLGVYDLNTVPPINLLLLLIITSLSASLNWNSVRNKKTAFISVIFLPRNAIITYFLGATIIYMSFQFSKDAADQAALRKVTDSLGLYYYFIVATLIVLADRYYGATEKNGKKNNSFEGIFIIMIFLIIVALLQRRELIIPLIIAYVAKDNYEHNIYLIRNIARGVIGITLIFIFSYIFLIVRTDSALFTSSTHPLQIFNSSEFWIVDMALMILSDGSLQKSLSFFISNNFTESLPYINYEHYYSIKLKVFNTNNYTPGFWVGGAYAAGGLTMVGCSLLLVAAFSNMIAWLGQKNTILMIFGNVLLYFVLRNGNPMIAFEIFVKISIFLIPILVISLIFQPKFQFYKC